ncbi:uncharacterized protein CcaverHIS019_0404360 [Cutaneotrichosporon cavernicola]|uniref:Uncharacterized protein n=1 Tax=Cutaneotrichosporon cavernicola TaxID=279322 RepID=A0AA48L450_9TREE|nr:uncharacterized protein CcaverHIS019_0404360 [Cutaneotrichosporon cavernicola]BEI91616.1 hypothetical protein CcaverHIS019_0404360 [Cutaneotrichosporon cavernicola]
MVGTGIVSTPSNILTGTGSVGLALIYWVIRRASPAPSFIIFILENLFLTVMPWVPPKGTTQSTSLNFFYATPAIVAVGVVTIMIVYY